MRVISPLLLAPIAAIVATATYAQPAAAQTEILKSDFGVFEADGPELRGFTPTTTVSLADKPSYGWIMLLKTDKPSVHWREEFTLPAAPAVWSSTDPGKPSEAKVSADRRTSVVERDVTPIDGVIFNAWKVADGDPKGHYVMRVVVDGQAEQRFEFDVN